MATSSRDRISVDLRGLGARFRASAQALGIPTSALLRRAVVDFLDHADNDEAADTAHMPSRSHSRRARLCIRLRADYRSLIGAAARRAGMSAGEYLGGLAAGVPALARGSAYPDHLAELRMSTAELATLGRNVHRLATLLRQGDLQQARPYRALLERIADDVRAHLEVAACVLADLRPKGDPSIGSGDTQFQSRKW